MLSVFKHCLQTIDLTKHKERIRKYVESRMTFIAPNLSIIVGASTAAKLMGEYVTQSLQPLYLAHG